MKLYELIARANQARISCKVAGNEFEHVHDEVILNLVNEHMPSGSGIDSGVVFSDTKSNTEHLVFNFGYHHMNENGFYTCWTNHVLHVTPSLVHGFDMRITGRDANGIKEYFYQVFEEALNQEIK